MNSLTKVLTNTVPTPAAGWNEGVCVTKCQVLSVVAIGLALSAATAGAVEVMALDEVRAGATGICLTEMDGGELVEVPLTVLGTVGPSSPEGEIVLVRLEDDRFRHTGIIAGMSGSPVYIDGRLLGALAFGWSFAKDPIGGVTPFSRMEGLVSDRTTTLTSGSGRPALSAMMAAGREGKLGELLTDWLAPAGAGQLHGLPVAVTAPSGWSPTAGGWLEESWRRLGWVVTPGGGGAEDAPAGGELAPGDMVAAVLVDGDATLAAGGTVTETRGDEVWAFGHPFLGVGDFLLPMARARVVTVLPSLASSFKFFSVGPAIGSFASDRTHGIWGRVGEAPPMVPVAVIVDGRSYHFRSIRHPGLTPFLAAYVGSASQASRGRVFGDQTVQLRLTVSYADRPPVDYVETISSGDAPAQTAALIAAVLAYLENTAFKTPALESVAIEMTTEQRLRGARLVDAVVSRRVVRPGEPVSVRLRLRPNRGVDVIRELAIEVPPGTPEGRLDLVVADGASWTLYDLGMRPYRPASFDDELRLIDRLMPSTDLVLALERKQSGVALSGGSVSMPPGLVAQLRGGLGPGLETTSYAVIAAVDEALEMPMSGAVRIELRVRAEDPLNRPEDS